MEITKSSYYRRIVPFYGIPAVLAYFLLPDKPLTVVVAIAILGFFSATVYTECPNPEERSRIFRFSADVPYNFIGWMQHMIRFG